MPGRSHVPAGISFRPVAGLRIRGDGPGTLCVTVACLLKWLGDRQRARKVPAAESVRAVDRAPCHPDESMQPAIGEMLVALHLPEASPLIHGDRPLIEHGHREGKALRAQRHGGETKAAADERPRRGPGR